MAARFWVNGTGEWNSTNTANWSSASGSTAAGASVPTSADTVTLDAASGGGTATVNSTIIVTSITMGAFTGTLDFSANDNNVTTQTFSNSGTGARTLNMGDGTWTITTPSATPWDQGTTTNLTFNSNASTLSIAASGTPSAQRVVSLGASLTYNALNINDPVLASSVVRRPIIFASAGNTLTTFSITNAYWIEITASTTTTITNGFSYSGSQGSPILIKSQSANSAYTLSVGGAVSLSWAAIMNCTKAGAGSIIATNSFDLGGNNGVTITSPGGGGGVISG